ncbi:MAG: hypothetical protein AAGK70_05740 [Pseudomonadota bacterium]
MNSVSWFHLHKAYSDVPPDDYEYDSWTEPEDEALCNLTGDVL